MSLLFRLGGRENDLSKTGTAAVPVNPIIPRRRVRFNAYSGIFSPIFRTKKQDVVERGEAAQICCGELDPGNGKQ